MEEPQVTNPAPEASAAPASAPSTPSAPAAASAPSTGQRASAQLRDLPPPAFDKTPVAETQVPVNGTAQTPETPVVATPEGPVVPQFLAQVRELGFQNVEDEAAAQARVIEAYRIEREKHQYLQQQHEQAVVYARQFAQLQQDPRWQAFQQQYSQPQAAPQPQSWWTAPQVDLSLLEQYREQTLDAEGKPAGWKWKDDAPADYKQQVQEYQHHLREWNEKIATRPHEVLPEIIRHEVQPLIQQAIQQYVQQTQQQTFAEQVHAKNEDWLYEQDPVTQRPLTDPVGNRVLTNEGRQVQQYIQEAIGYGINDPQARWKYAMTQLEVQLRRKQATLQQTHQSQATRVAEQKMQHLTNAAQAATSATPRTGSIPAPHDPGKRSQRRGVSAGEKLEAAFKAQGLGVMSPIQP